MAMLHLSWGSVLEEQGDRGMTPFSGVTTITKQHTACTLTSAAGVNKYPQHVSHECSGCEDLLAVAAGTSLTLLVSCSELTN